MKDQKMFWVLLLVVVMVLNSARAGVTKEYFVNGGDLKLRPTVTPDLTSILWKHKGDLLAEWIKDNVDLTYYGDYNNRTTLDLTTGHLLIRKMDETKDSGSYTLEINNKVHDQSYDATAIKEVPKPSIWIRPLNCDGLQVNCTLVCEGTTEGAGPVTYTWMMDDTKLEEEKEKEALIFRSKTQQAKTFSCTMKNPVSEKTSDPKENPFFVESSSGGAAGPVVGVIISLLILGGVGVGVWQRERIKGLFSPSDSGNAANPAPASKPETNSQPAEEEPLKNGEDGKTDAPETA